MENFFKKLGLDVVIPFLLILLLFIFFVSYNQVFKRILVIHSYNTDYSWVKDVNKGLESVLKNADSIKIDYFYMDAKRHYQEHVKEQSGIEARRMIDRLKPDVVITCDDDAQSYVTTYYKNNPNLSFVFLGINAEPEDYGFDKANNITGIVERLPLAGLNSTILEMAKSLNIQKPIRIGHICGYSLTSKLDDDHIRQYKDWNQIILKPSQLPKTFSEWKRAILDANNDLDFIIISNYRKIHRSRNDQTLVSASEIMKWTVENAKIPIIGLNSFVVEDGAPFAVSTSGVEQGRVAAIMALKIIQDNIPPVQLPVQKPEQFIVSMRPKIMEKFSMNLPDIYAASARVSNTYFE